MRGAVEYAELGWTGTRVSRIGLGTWQIGTSYRGWGREFTWEEAVRVIRTGYRAWSELRRHGRALWRG